MKKRNSEFILWSAFVLAAVSLVISLWTATAVSNLNQQLVKPERIEIEQQVQEDLDELRLEVQQTSQMTDQEIQQRLAEIRLDLETALAEVDQETRDEWREFDARLEELEESFEQNSVTARQDLSDFLEEIQQELEGDDLEN